MARQNRVSVCDGIYHVTARIAHRAMLFRDAAVKDKVVEILLGAADFSGVELYAWCVMDNHLHLLVHVPRVPERYWLKPGEEPAAYAFGTRPPACRVPLWHPEGDSPHPASPDGDTPLDTRSRPPLGFALPDDEMIARLASLYGAAKAKRIEREWSELRKRGLGATVDDEKSRQCRRMYNLSQYVKTVKERISTWYNETRGHEGCLWQGRFHSGVVERVPDVLAIVAAYVGYNPVKAGVSATPSRWRWSSYALAAADEGASGARCREMYSRMLGLAWDEVRERLESVYADRLPDGLTPEELKRLYDRYDDRADEKGGTRPPSGLRASQAIRSSMWFFSHGAYIGKSEDFLRKLRESLPRRFPMAGAGSIRRCRAFVWALPEIRRRVA